MNNGVNCETSYILINASALEGLDNITTEIWCPDYNEFCEQSLDTSQFWLEGVIATTIAFAGMLMNIAFCYVLSRKDMRNVFNSLLIALAVFDNTFLLSIILESFRTSFEMATYIQIFLFPKFLYPISNIAFCSSIFMIIAISMERYIAVRRPIRVHLETRNDKKAQVRRIAKYVISVCVFCTIVNLPKFFEATTYYNDQTEELQLDYNKLRINPNYIYYYIVMFMMIITVIVPFSTILCLNAATYSIIRKRQRIPSSANQQNENNADMNDKAIDNLHILRMHTASTEDEKALEKKLSIIFLAISILFLVFHLPRAILILYEVTVASKIEACRKAGYYRPFPLWALHMNFVSEVFLVINSSVNSAVYCSFSKKYRDEAKNALKCFKCLQN